MTRADVPSGKTSQSAHGDERARAVDRELEPDLREAQDLERLGEGLRVERERERVVRPLVAGEVRRSGPRPSRRRPRRRSTGRPGARAARSAAAPRRRVSMRDDGHSSSATQRPGRTSYIGRGSTESCIQTRSIGSSMTPVSMPLSQWSNQRTHSWRKPMLGPGSALVGEVVRPRADEPLPRRGETGEQARDGVRVAVGEASDRVHRALDRGVVLADRAVLPVGVPPLVGEPVPDVRRRALEAVEPGLAPAVAEDVAGRAAARSTSASRRPSGACRGRGRSRRGSGRRPRSGRPSSRAS